MAPSVLFGAWCSDCSRESRFSTVFLAAIGLFAAGMDVLAQGQPGRNPHGREQNRELIDDYSNSIIERDDYGDRNRRPLTQDPGNGLTQEMKLVRPLIHDFAEAASQLTYAINDQMNRIAGLRSLYSDALTISAEAVGLDRRAAKTGDHRPLLDEFEQLDADWRELAYRLQGVRGMGTDTRELVASLSGLDQQIRNALNTQPQVNRQDVSLVAAGLAGDLQNLSEDISAELGRSQNGQQLQIQASRVRQMALSLASLSRDDQYDSATLVREYKQFETAWSALASRLQAEDNRYVQRTIRRISQSNGRMHQLLLLPQVMDKSQLTFLAMTLKKDLNDFFSRTPLIMVIHLPKASRAIATADQFHGVCDHFIDLVNAGEDNNSLIDAFRYIEEANRSFTDVFGEIDSDGAIAVLQRIEQTLNTIRTSLHIEREDFDRYAAGDLVASVENLTEKLDLAARQWLTNDPQPFANACRQETAAMASQAAAIHNDLVRGVPVSQVRREVDELYERWRTVYKYIIKCQQPEDRRILSGLSSRLTPAMVELRTRVSQQGVEQTALRPQRR